MRIIILIALFFSISCSHIPSSKELSSSKQFSRQEKNSTLLLTLDDEFKWLTERDSDKVRTWIKKQNEVTEAEIKDLPYYQKIKDKILKFANSEEKISYGTILGTYYYHILKNADYPKGTLRRIFIKDFVQKNTSWELLMSSDSAIQSKNQSLDQNLFLTGFSCLPPSYQHCLLSYSISGSDSVVVKEFDTLKKVFIEDGFNINTPFKTKVRWKNKNEIYVITKITGDDVTDSSYGSTMRVWERGKPIQSSVEIARVPKNHLGIFFNTDLHYAGEYLSYYDAIDFKYFQFYSYYESQIKKIIIPNSKRRSVFKNIAFFTLLEDGLIQDRHYSKNETIGIDLKSLHLNNTLKVKSYFKTSNNSAIEDIVFSKNYIWVTEFNNLFNNITRINPEKPDQKKVVSKFKNSLLNIVSASAINDDLLVTAENLLSSEKLYHYSNAQLQLIHKSPEKFDSHDFTSEVLWTKSKDGTPVPYYLVRKKNMKYDASTPTLLFGYGAGNVITSPTYMGNRGFAWLETGGAYVHAIIRGGGEFGADWRAQGMKEHKQNTFNDCIAILEDLIKRKITRPELIGIYGSSWGGLMVTSVMMQRPDLMSVVQANEPMLDMINYPLLPIGESWLGEFGDPKDLKFNDYLKKYSPYHNISANKVYPTVLFTASMNDDRMHPAHARRMVASMQKQTLGKVFYYESLTGGHSGNAENEFAASMWALKFSFLRKYLDPERSTRSSREINDR